jgi:ubiquinone/menaquinone biosynthesis C-methylase UbiE/uncharacterized protein YbaR (Trm112 family)
MQPSILDRYSSLQSIFCCPTTKGPLRLVGVEELRSCLPDAERERIPTGTLGAFISDATNRAYPLTERIADFLEQDSLEIQLIPPGTASTVVPTSSHEDVKRSVKDWYDRFGWKKIERGTYKDTAIWSQNEPVAYGLYEMMAHLSILDRFPGGEFILDAASGAIAHPEYLAFSWFYKIRICVDLSKTALEEAAAKLRQEDLCCMADLCNLPFRDETFDGAVSGYTVQHVPESQQIPAIRELYRVIRPNAHLCIITDVKQSRRHSAFTFALRAILKSLRVLRLARPYHPSSFWATARDPALEPPHELYVHVRESAWWRNVARELTDKYSIECLRLLSVYEFNGLCGRSNRAAKALRLIESLSPRLTSNMASVCLVDICKPARDKV